VRYKPLCSPISHWPRQYHKLSPQQRRRSPRWPQSSSDEPAKTCLPTIDTYLRLFCPQFVPEAKPKDESKPKGATVKSKKALQKKLAQTSDTKDVRNRPPSANANTFFLRQLILPAHASVEVGWRNGC